MGPVAWEVAAKVKGLVIRNKTNADLAVIGEPKAVINALVGRYEYIWGNIGTLESREVSNDLLKQMQSKDIPDKLK